MEIPAEVMVHCDSLGLKGTKGRLLQASPHGYYEIILSYGDQKHRTLLPIARTVLIAADPEERPGLATDVER